MEFAFLVPRPLHLHMNNRLTKKLTHALIVTIVKCALTYPKSATILK